LTNGHGSNSNLSSVFESIANCKERILDLLQLS
jgi:hypothetical protein